MKTYVIKQFHYLTLTPERSTLPGRYGVIIAFIGLLCEPSSSLMYLRDQPNESVNAETAYPGN